MAREEFLHVLGKNPPGQAVMHRREEERTPRDGRTWGAPFMMRVTSPVLLFLTCAIVYLSVGLNGTKRCSV